MAGLESNLGKAADDSEKSRLNQTPDGLRAEGYERVVNRASDNTTQAGEMNVTTAFKDAGQHTGNFLSRADEVLRLPPEHLAQIRESAMDLARTCNEVAKTLGYKSAPFNLKEDASAEDILACVGRMRTTLER